MQCDVCGANSADYRNLTPDASTVVSARTGKTVSSVCPSDYNKFMRFYESKQKICANPLKVHKKPRKSGLRVNTLEMFTKNNIFIPGQKLCVDCRVECKKSNQAMGEDLEPQSNPDGVADLPDSQQSIQSATSHSSWTTAETDMAKVDKALNLLDISPVKKGYLSTAYFSEKLKKVETSLTSKLGVEDHEYLEESAENVIKTQFLAAVSSSDKYKVLTSCPTTWV